MKLCGMDGMLKNQHATYRRESWNTGRSVGGQGKWYRGPFGIEDLCQSDGKQE